MSQNLRLLMRSSAVTDQRLLLLTVPRVFVMVMILSISQTPGTLNGDWVEAKELGLFISSDSYLH